MYPYMAKSKIDKNVKVPGEVLEYLLTSSEIRMLKNRWQILNLLEEGLSIRNIAKEVKVGTDTVVRVARMIEKKDLRIFLDKSLKTTESKIPWIFGKSE